MFETFTLVQLNLHTNIVKRMQFVCKVWSVGGGGGGGGHSFPQKTLNLKCFTHMTLAIASLMTVQISNHITSCNGPEVIKLFSCSTQLRLKFILLINVKMLC